MNGRSCEKFKGLRITRKILKGASARENKEVSTEFAFEVEIKGVKI